MKNIKAEKLVVDFRNWANGKEQSTLNENRNKYWWCNLYGEI
jgi:hypothetical protein